MALADGQVQIRDLVMGPGTNYEILDDFDPWTRTVRADQSEARAWGHGSWSGAEWTEEAVVPMRIRVRNLQDGTPGGWLAAHQALAAAFGASHDDLEMRFAIGGTEYLMFGRPRMVEPDTRTIRRGYTITRAAFAALDPTIYSGVEHSVTLGLPSTSGGLAVPFAVPLAIPATVTAGRAKIANAGTTATALRLRVDGPVPEHRVSLLTPAGTAMVRLWLSLEAGQWLDIDTGRKTVYLNGTASRRGNASKDGIGWPELPPGTHELAFDATTYVPGASMTARWRDAW